MEKRKKEGRCMCCGCSAPLDEMSNFSDGTHLCQVCEAGADGCDNPFQDCDGDLADYCENVDENLGNK